MKLSLSTAIVAVAALVRTVVSETHTVRLNNMCGLGSVPTLASADGTILATGNTAQYVSNSSLVNAAIFFRTLNGRHHCGINGCNGTTLHTTLSNENGSQTTFDLPTIKGAVGYSYFNGCDDVGATCANPECPAKDAEIVCRAQDVGLLVTFCPKL